MAFSRTNLAALLVAGGVGIATLGCAGVKAPNMTGGGGAGGSSSGRGGASGSVGNTGAAGDVGGGPPSDAAACQTMDIMFKPKTPTVYVLVDRSGSEFDGCPGTTGVYFRLRSAVLQVVQDLQAQVRFGFGAFSGYVAGNQCPIFDQVPTLDVNNYGPISTLYNSLAQLDQCHKAETPAVEVIPMVKAKLVADMAVNDGPKYVLFVTDSQTDYCDDGGPRCPADSVTYMIQDLYAAGISTLVIGLPSSQSNLAPGALQAFANAGAGQPVAVPRGPGETTTPLDIYNECAGNSPWRAIWTTAGRTGMVPTATYAGVGGTAQVFAPTGTDQAALAAQITAALAGVKSCVFDLSTFKIDLQKLNEASVLIDGNVVPLDTRNNNGWDMTSDTQLQLFGSACDTWRDPASVDIKFNFPCDIIVP